MLPMAGTSPEGPPRSDFATTRWSQVVRAAQPDQDGRASLDWLCRAYWEPLRRHAQRRGWRDAEDAVQDFWLTLISRGAIGQADPTRGRFRTWLLTCLDHHLADRHDARVAQKRGGALAHVPLAGDEPVPADGDPGLAFDRAWAETVLARAQGRLEAETTGAASERLRVLAPFLARNGSSEAYARAGSALALSEGAVKVAVHRLRHRFRTLVREEVAQTLGDPTPAAIDAEIAHLIAALGGNRSERFP